MGLPGAHFFKDLQLSIILQNHNLAKMNIILTPKNSQETSSLDPISFTINHIHPDITYSTPSLQFSNPQCGYTESHAYIVKIPWLVPTVKFMMSFADLENFKGI